MGEAYDRAGHMLGSAFGDTKRDVFDKLMEQHPDAAELRIRSLRAAIDGTSAEMPRYKCHKEVWALKITGVDPTGLLQVEKPYGDVHVGEDYIQKHKPQAGGYYVVYKDGYKSFSPADAFEEGYTRL